MLIGVGLPTALIAYLSITSTRDLLIQDREVLETQIGQSVSTLVGAHMQSSLSELVALESGLRDASGHLDMSPASQGKAGTMFLTYLKGGGKALTLQLLDTQGKGTQAGYAINEEPGQRRVQEAFLNARTSGRPVFGEPVFSHGLNHLIVVLARPVFNGKTQVGVLLSVVGLDPLLRAIREGSWSGHRVFIVDQNGKLFADLDPNRMVQNQDYSEHELVKAVRSLQGAGTITRSFTDRSSGKPVPMVGTGVLIAETGWIVIAQIAGPAAYAGISSAVWKIISLTLGALLLAVALSFYFSHKTVRPLRQLAESARQVAAGNYAVEISLKDHGEIGVVAEAFQEMARQIQQNLSNLKQTVEDSKQLFLGIVRAFANAIDGKDPYTRGHTERVARFSVEIAKIMELPEDEVEKIKIAGLLHDIGKIAIDDKILKKPAVLTDEEYQIMKTHPQRGYEMMKHIPQLKDIIPGIYCHHEQLDGKGYPQGLKGDELAMIARIIMVADCFDAMTTKRPYQDPAPIDHVLGVIRSLTPDKYDPRVVEALVRGVKTGRIIPHTAT